MKRQTRRVLLSVAAGVAIVAVTAAVLIPANAMAASATAPGPVETQA